MHISVWQWTSSKCKRTALTGLALTVLAQFDQACLKGHEKRVMVEAVCLAVGHFREEDFLQGATKKSSLSRMLWQVI